MYSAHYRQYKKLDDEAKSFRDKGKRLVPSLLKQYRFNLENEVTNAWTRMRKCTLALEALDRQGWKRSFHQKQFHDQFMRASVRVFYKTETDGVFEREHKQLLEHFGWDSLPQEMLISTPRRFGKTISVSLFCAAMIFAAPRVEISIYSTCKRISQKLLQNVSKFIGLIYEELKIAKYPVIRQNMEEIVLRGPEGSQDVRIVNSYPSKVNPVYVTHNSELIS
jgi:hypothetical protein